MSGRFIVVQCAFGDDGCGIFQCQNQTKRRKFTCRICACAPRADSISPRVLTLSFRRRSRAVGADGAFELHVGEGVSPRRAARERATRREARRRRHGPAARVSTVHERGGTGGSRRPGAGASPGARGVAIGRAAAAAGSAALRRVRRGVRLGRVDRCPRRAVLLPRVLGSFRGVALGRAARAATGRDRLANRRTRAPR